MFNFVPDNQQSTKPPIPFFEDATADYAPYYASKKSVNEAVAELALELSKLDAFLIGVQAGHFPHGKYKRYGYVVRFSYNGKDGLLRAAGLPMRSETAHKVERTRVQALLNVKDWLKSLVTQKVFGMDAHPLLSHLLVSGEETLAEYIVSTGNLLPAGGEIVEGQFTLSK